MRPNPFLIALQFLTVFPVRMSELPDNKMMGRSLLYYPVIGLLIGLLLLALGWLGNGMPASLHAAALLAFWVALTGALHLDGLADSADAWIGGLARISHHPSTASADPSDLTGRSPSSQLDIVSAMPSPPYGPSTPSDRRLDALVTKGDEKFGLGDRQKTLAIMKDPYCGPAAVVTLVLVLLIKFAALEHLITTENWQALALTPVLGRTALVLLFLTTPYVRENGLGSLLSKHFPRRASLVILLLTLATVPFFTGITALWLLFTMAGSFFALRALMLRRIGGATGDTAGALVEISETVMLLTAALME